MPDALRKVTPRFMVESDGLRWLIYDTQNRIVVPESRGELDGRILVAELMNRSWEEKCQKQHSKVVPIR